MNAEVVSVPLLCCSGPRAVSTIACAAPASSSTVRRSSAVETPVIRSTRSGQYAASRGRTRPNPLVRPSTYGWSR